LATNGRLPSSALSKIAGGGKLEHKAAAAWNAMAVHIFEKTGVKIAPNGPLSSYRTYEQQVYMKQIHGDNAATPGTSNHGWGLAVDTDDYTIINRYGAQFGWQKAWSDASWEPWHFKYAAGHYSGKNPGPDYKDTDPVVKKLRRKIARKVPTRKKLSAQLARIKDRIKKAVRKISNWRKRIKERT
jgi:hypothetical protein